MIIIDGSYGEGGGQILRTSLGLSMVTGKPVHIKNIRAGRKKPGLLRQHLTATKAATQISCAEVEGAELGSRELVFTPQAPQTGSYHFAVGTAGSATLVLQTILPALLAASGKSDVTIEGGTHNPYAPPFHFLKEAFLPLLGKMGCKIDVSLERYGFYPAGGGIFKVAVESGELSPLELLERGEIREREVRGVVAQIPVKIAADEVDIITRGLNWDSDAGVAEEVNSPGPGNVVMVKVASENVTELFTGFGELRVPLKRVARNAMEQAKRYLASEAPVGRFLADQLLVPMAIAGAGRFRTLAPTMHTMTNMDIIKKFCDVQITSTELEHDLYEIELRK